MASMISCHPKPQSILKLRCLVEQTSIVLDLHDIVSFGFKRKFIRNVLRSNILDILNGKTAIKERRDIRSSPKYY
jgi:hypothetical protein